MVSSITPGATGANAFGVEQRLAHLGQRAGEAGVPRQGDRIDAAVWSGARDSVRGGLALVHEALAVGHEAQSLLLQVRELARTGGDDAQAKLDSLLTGFSQRLEAAVARGARLLEGEALAVEAEPGAAPVDVAGADLRLKVRPEPKDVLQISANARADDAELAQQALVSLDRLQGAMEKLLDAARALEAHQGFLGALDGAGVRHDLDADGARLLALQARQGLSAVGAKPIANAEPQAVLSLFRV